MSWLLVAWAVGLWLSVVASSTTSLAAQSVLLDLAQHLNAPEEIMTKIKSLPVPVFASKDDMPDETDPKTLISAVDASLDQAQKIIDSIDVSSLPPEVQQALSLLIAAGESIDEAMDAMNIPDPDEEQAMSKSLPAIDDLDAFAAQVNRAAGSDTPTYNTQKGGTVLTPEQQAVIDSLPEEEQAVFANLSKSAGLYDSGWDEDDDLTTVLEKADPAIRRIIEKQASDLAAALEVAKTATVTAETERDLRVHRARGPVCGTGHFVIAGLRNRSFRNSICGFGDPFDEDCRIAAARQVEV